MVNELKHILRAFTVYFSPNSLSSEFLLATSGYYCYLCIFFNVAVVVVVVTISIQLNPLKIDVYGKFLIRIILTVNFRPKMQINMMNK